MRNRKNYTPSDPIINTDDYLTVPDETYSVREILERFATGQNIDSIKRNITYTNSDENDWTMPYMATLDHDLTDLDNVRSKVIGLEKKAREEYIEYVNKKKSKNEIKESSEDNKQIELNNNDLK